MTKYAHYDPALDDSPIKGYYDTELHEYVLPTDGSLFILSDYEWEQHFTRRWCIKDNQFQLEPPPVDPPPTQEELADAEIATRLEAGIVITSATAPGLNGTYRLDAVSTAQIYQIGLYASQLGMFPSGGQTFQYPDVNGMPHTFTVAQFISFLKLVAPLATAIMTQAQMMKNGLTPTWPTQTGVI